MAIKSPHSSNWLIGLQVSACGIHLSDEAIRSAVGLKLGLNLCEPHICPCGANVDARGLHGLFSKRSTGRSTRHQPFNDIIWRAFKRADIPATKEPAGLVRGDGKRPDGLTLVPWQGVHCLTWYATIVDTLAVLTFKLVQLLQSVQLMQQLHVKTIVEQVAREALNCRRSADNSER